MTKIISISDQAYEELKKIKAEDESFTKVILRVAEKEKRKPLMAFFGKWPGPKEELGLIQKDIQEGRKRFKTRDIRFP